MNGDQNSVKTRLKDIALSSYYNYNGQPSAKTLTKAEFLALKELSANKDIIVQKSDKGNSVVILNKIDYVNKMLDILNDQTKFTKLEFKGGKEYNHIVNIEKRITQAINRLKKNKKIDDETCKKLTPVGSKLGIMYGLGKVHKPGCPLRPILSAIGTSGYQIAKFLVPLLEPITINNFTVKDSFAFAKELWGLDSDGLFMASLDVKSLFTNIPLEETINICLDNIFKNQETIAGLNKLDFQILLNFAVKDMTFKFNGESYQQIDGVAMGSPLGPALANAFMAHHERSWLEKCPKEFKPVVYRRYVDDTFLLLRSPDHLDKFRDYMNQQHKNIEFTSEVEQDDKMPFLDVDILKSNGKFNTSIYRKPTFSGVYANSDSFIPTSFKYGLVYSLLHRAYSICHNYSQIHTEFVKLKAILFRNGYSNSFVDCCVSKFMYNISKPRTKLPTVEKKSVLICLPFLGQCSLQVKSRIECLFKKCLPQVRCKFVFKSSVRLSSYFSFKDLVPFALRSGVVYTFQCGNCNVTYIGKTKRHLHTRVSEHLGISPLTGRKTAQATPSAIFDHCIACKHTPLANEFSITTTDSKDWFLLLKESLLIGLYKPELNAAVRSTPLSLF